MDYASLVQASKRFTLGATSQKNQNSSSFRRLDSAGRRELGFAEPHRYDCGHRIGIQNQVTTAEVPSLKNVGELIALVDKKRAAKSTSTEPPFCSTWLFA